MSTSWLIAGEIRFPHFLLKKFIVLLYFLISVAFTSLSEASHFIGFSNNRVSSDQGLVGMNKACKSTYHPEARICNSREIVDTAWPYTLGARTAWVHPLIVATYFDNHSLNQVDYSGVISDTLSCTGWKSRSLLEYGLAVDGYLRFHAVQCGASHNVACCE